MTNIEAMKLALDALNYGLHVGFDESSESQIKKCTKAFQQSSNAIAALRQAISEAEQEPVKTSDLRAEHNKMMLAYDVAIKRGLAETNAFKLCDEMKSIFAPPQREWVSLTDGEVCATGGKTFYEFARAIEAKLKEKNT